MLIRNVRPWGGAPADVLVEGTRIAAIGPNLAAPAGAPVEDGGGAILLPGLIEGHCHLDKSVWGLGWYVNTVGPRLIEWNFVASSRERLEAAKDDWRAGRFPLPVGDDAEFIPLPEPAPPPNPMS